MDVSRRTIRQLLISTVLGRRLTLLLSPPEARMSVGVRPLKTVAVPAVICAVFLCLAIPVTVHADRTWNHPGWMMTFDDEFNSNAVDTTKWNIQNGANGANNEL